MQRSSKAMNCWLISLAALFVFMGWQGTSSAIPPGPSQIRVTLQTASAKHTSSGLFILNFKVFNRPAYRNPIGISVLVCRQVYPQVKECRQYFKLQRGQVITFGLVTALSFYRLAVIGGTGYYDNVGGSLVQQRIGKDAFSVVLNLAAI